MILPVLETFIDYQLFSLYVFVFFEVLPETENELEKALELDPQELVITCR